MSVSVIRGEVRTEEIVECNNTSFLSTLKQLGDKNIFLPDKKRSGNFKTRRKGVKSCHFPIHLWWPQMSRAVAPLNFAEFDFVESEEKIQRAFNFYSP